MMNETRIREYIRQVTFRNEKAHDKLRQIKNQGSTKAERLMELMDRNYATIKALQWVLNE